MAESTKSDPKPVGSAASFTTTSTATTNDSTSLPLSGRAPLPGESSDPTVQHLLAVKQAHQMTRDVLDPPVVDTEQLKKVDEQIAEVDDQLADLGFEQQSQADRKAGLEKAAADEQKKADAVEKRRADRAAAREKAAEKADK
jgi:hypothetical protein